MRKLSAPFLIDRMRGEPLAAREAYRGIEECRSRLRRTDRHSHPTTRIDRSQFENERVM